MRGGRSATAQKGLFTVVVLSFLLGAGEPATEASPVEDGDLLGCPESESLANLVLCLKGRMPLRDSERYERPSEEERTSFFLRALVMLETGCEIPMAPLPPLEEHWLVPFHDPVEERTYCVFAEVPGPGESTASGLGAFIVPQEPGGRSIHVQIAHPIFDLGTLEQGTQVFQETDARSLLIAGAHRAANAHPSGCQKEYLEADVAHCDRSAFQAATQAVMEHHAQQGSSYVVVQFHGMATSSCPGTDVHLTDGTPAAPEPGSFLWRARSQLRQEHPDWTVTAPGDGSGCRLQGTKNVQGRLINGVPSEDVCDEPAEAASGRFLHVEQAPGHRLAEDWSGALAIVWDKWAG